MSNLTHYQNESVKQVNNAGIDRQGNSILTVQWMIQCQVLPCYLKDIRLCKIQVISTLLIYLLTSKYYL